MDVYIGAHRMRLTNNNRRGMLAIFVARVYSRVFTRASDKRKPSDS